VVGELAERLDPDPEGGQRTDPSKGFATFAAMRRLGLSSAALALLVALVAGCGGGGGDESTAAATAESEPAALSKTELISQGDAICAEVNAAVGAAGSTSSGAGETIVQVAGLYSGMVERLKGLGPPREESAGYAGFITSAEELAQAESNVKLAYEREETEELSAASGEVSTALTKFESAAREFGFERCAEAPTAPSPSGSGGEESSGEGSSGGFEAEEAAPEEVEAAPEEAPPVEEESAGGGAGVGGGTEGGAGGGSSGGIGPG
jgi:hypothetical protein